MKTKSEAETKTDGATLKPTDSLVCSLDKNIKPESVGLPFNGQENNVMSQKSENAGYNAVKVSQRDRRRLEAVLSDAKRGLAFLMADDTAVMRKSSLSSSDTFSAPFYPGVKYSQIAKDIGSELVLLQTAIRKLESAIYGEVA